MFTLAFWQATLERAIKTFAQAWLAVIGSGAINIIQVEFGASLLAALMAALISVLTSIAGGVARQAPSWGPENLKPKSAKPVK